MINKQNLWFVTLFSMILILGIYYITMDDESLKMIATNNPDSEEVINIEDSDILVALRVKEDEETLKEMENYQEILLDATKTIEEKNDAYTSLQTISNNKSETIKIEQTIKSKFSLDSFSKINGNTINIVIASNKHNPEIANKIIREVQSLYKTKKFITVKFE